MKKIIALLIFPVFFIQAQEVTVPEEIYFAGMKLKLSHGVRKSIQEDIAAITKNQKYFSQKIDRANLYFPLIEKIFQEEDCPADFKYLALQESSLVSDVVSTSNAVGYWQFKKESAQEVGLRVDREVDERMNIVSSTRGAAKYMKKNNFFLNNWVYTLLAYNMGRGGVASQVKEKYRGATEMEIDKDMHWYVIRFLAHKLAYENLVGKYPHPDLVLFIHPEAGSKSLQQVASEVDILYEDVQFYNKWLLCSRVPEDKGYAVVLPVKSELFETFSARFKQFNSHSQRTVADKTAVRKEEVVVKTKVVPKQASNHRSGERTSEIVMFNKLKAIRAREGDTFAALAFGSHIELKKFLKRNDVNGADKPVQGQYYYLEAKRSAALVAFHTVKQGETLWDISQKYGIRINNILRKNRMKMGEAPRSGRVLWLNAKRPRKTPIEYKEIPILKEQVKVEKQLLVQELTKDPVQEIKKDESNVVPEVATRNVINVPKESVSPSYHTVEAGQTLYAISKLYRTKVDSLLKWNSIGASGLSVGSSIIVGKENAQKGTNASGNKIVYLAKPGDTIYKISRDFNVSVQDLQKWNNKNDFNVSIGEQIVILK